MESNCQVKKSLYDSLIILLLVWCVLQDFVLCILFRLTGAAGPVKILLYSKDILLLVLFIWVLVRVRIPVRFSVCCMLFFVIVLIQTFVGFSRNSVGVVSMFSAIRGLVLLPAFTLIGYAVGDKERFICLIKKYYWFLVMVAAIGILEFVADVIVGTEGFWLDTLQLDEFYESIKGSSAALENGKPSNWYTYIGNAKLRRLISLWAAPLTAGFVLLMPCMYYTFELCSRKKPKSLHTTGNRLKVFWGLIISAVALILTYTRQTLLPYIAIALLVFVYFRKQNRKVLIIGGIIVFLLAVITLWDKIVNYIYNGSTKVHLLRIEETAELLHLTGAGIGSFGTRFMGGIATESQYITLMGQLGILAVIPYLFMLLYPIFYCIRKSKSLDGNKSGFIWSICLCGLIFAVAGIVSETVAAYTSIAQYYVLIGFAYGYCSQNGKECGKER